MANFEEIREKIDECITKKGFTYRDVSLKIGRKDSYIQQYVKYGFPKRLKEVDRKKIAVVLDMDEKELVDDELMVDVLDGELVYKDVVSGRIFDFLNLGIYELGDKEEQDKLIGKLMLDKDEFGEVVGLGDRLRIIKKIGDDMSDVILENGLVVYNEEDEFKGDGIYVINYDEKVLVKRLQLKSGDEFWVISDNKNYVSFEVKKGDFRILGKVKGVLNLGIL